MRYGEELDHLPEMRALDAARPSARIALRSSRNDVLIEAALALGAEIMLPEVIGRGDHRFEIADVAGSEAERPLYLLIHPDRARIPTVARTATWVEETMRSWNAGA